MLSANTPLLAQPVAILVLKHQESAAAAHLSELVQTADRKTSLQLGFDQHRAKYGWLCNDPLSGKAEAMCIVVEDTGDSPPKVLVSPCMELSKTGHQVV